MVGCTCFSDHPSNPVANVSLKHFSLQQNTAAVNQAVRARAEATAMDRSGAAISFPDMVF